MTGLVGPLAVPIGWWSGGGALLVTCGFVTVDSVRETGFAGAAGIVEGWARVIATAEGDQLQTGEVLVTCVWYGLLEGKE